MAAVRISTIDGLRGLAIIAVVTYHIWQLNWQPLSILGLSLQPLIETGFLGVDLFFFISGFVLMLPYKTAPPSLGHFAVRRFLKIVPSYAFCIAVLLLVGYDHVQAKNVAFHLLFVHNWFAETSASINGVFWSLAVEIQFYLLVPFLAPAFVRRPILMTALLFAIANGWRLWCTFSNHYFYTLRLEQLPAEIDLFAAGMLAACLTPACSPTRHKTAFSVLMVAGIVLSIVLMNDCFVHRHESEWPNFWNARSRSGLALAFFCTAVGSLHAWRPLQAMLANRPLLFAAAISYNLYLWHQPLARALLTHRLPPYAGDPHDDHVWQIAFWFVALSASVAVAAALTYLLERPILHTRRWTIVRRRRETQHDPP